MANKRGHIEQIQGVSQIREGTSYRDLPEGVIEVPSVGAGLQTGLPRNSKDAGGAEEANNARIRLPRLRRRPGTKQYFDDTENEDVLALIPFIDQSGAIFLVRITTARITVDTGDGSWTDYVTGLSLESRYSHAAFLDNLYLANQSHKIRQVDFGGGTANEIAAAPKAKYITNFAERIIAANIDSGTIEPYKIKWPINSDPTNWTGTGSGEENLVSGISDLSDDIVGLFGFEQQMIILRKRSIWLAQRQPFADNPFRFIPAVSGYGCDMPHTARAVKNGIIYGNFNDRAIYFYQIGQLPQKISQPIEDQLFDNLADLDYSQAAFDEFNAEYYLGEAQVLDDPTLQKTYVYSQEIGAWTEDDQPEYTALANAAAGIVGIFIDSLSGTIDSLSGFIDDLGGGTKLSAGIFKAKAEKVFLYDPTQTLDYDGSDFTFTFVSPNLGSIQRRRSIQDVGMNVYSESGCTVAIAISTDRVDWRHEKTITVPSATDLQQIFLRRQRITGTDLYVRVTASGGDFELDSYWVRILEKGQAR